MKFGFACKIVACCLAYVVLGMLVVFALGTKAMAVYFCVSIALIVIVGVISFDNPDWVDRWLNKFDPD